MSRLVGSLMSRLGTDHANVQRGAVYYQPDTELEDLPSEEQRPLGGLDVQMAIDLCRLANVCYLEKSGCYWRSNKRAQENFFVAEAEQLSIGLMKVTGIIPSGEQLGFKFVGPENDMGFDNGLVRNGILKEKTTDTDLVIMENEEKRMLAVIWRGTESFADVRSDINAWSTVWPYSQPNVKLYVSAGFEKAHQCVIDPVLSALKRLWATGKYNRIVCAGHSLGGALAHLNAHALSYLMEEELKSSDLPMEERLVCYTIGAPRAGNSNFAEDYTRRVPHTYRIVNEKDVVPRLPVPRRNHVGTPVLMDEHYFYVNPSKEKHREALYSDTDVGKSISDHLPPRYLSILLGHYIRQHMSAEQNKSVDNAWIALVRGERTPRTVLSVEVPANKKNDPLAFSVKPVTRAEPSDSSMRQVLVEAFGPERASAEVLEHLILYSRKCTETHVFRPWEFEFDDEDLTIHNFREGVWSLIVNPDDARRLYALETARLRRAFDFVDADGNGLIIPQEFSNTASLVFADDAATLTKIRDLGAERILHTSMEGLYKRCNLSYPKDLAPTELSFHEFAFWARMNEVDSSKLVEKVRAQISRIPDRD